MGVDLVPKKVCVFDCIYCQLGKTRQKTVRRFSYVDFGALRKEFKKILSTHPQIDYVTLAGAGEPTLHKDLDKIISVLKNEAKEKIPLCMITNSSLLYRSKVRKEIQGLDLIVPSLDAVTPSVFRKINQPYPSITVDKVIEGLIRLRGEFKGKIWLEIMLVGGINDTQKEARRFRKVIPLIHPDKVQLNIPVRPATGTFTVPSPARIKRFGALLGGNAEVVSPFYEKKQKKFENDLQAVILEYVKRRPATLDDLIASLGVHSSEIVKCLTMLFEENKIREQKFKGKIFYTALSNQS